MIYRPPRFLLRRYELLKRLQPGTRFLEIGAGNLFLTPDLLSYFKDGVIVEFNPKARLLFSQLSPEIKNRLQLINQDFLKAKIPGKFDCIVACEVLEHVENDTGFLTKAASLLRPDGQLFISVPAHDKYWSIHDENVGHLRRYERETLKRLLEGAGLADVAIHSYGLPLIHLLRLMRVSLARLEKKRLARMDQTSRTQDSGMPRTSLTFQLAGMVSNPITITPFAMLGSLFNTSDLSDGYLATGRRSKAPLPHG